MYMYVQNETNNCQGSAWGRLNLTFGELLFQVQGMI